MIAAETKIVYEAIRARNVLILRPSRFVDERFNWSFSNIDEVNVDWTRFKRARM